MPDYTNFLLTSITRNGSRRTNLEYSSALLCHESCLEFAFKATLDWEKPPSTLGDSWPACLLCLLSNKCTLGLTRLQGLFVDSIEVFESPLFVLLSFWWPQSLRKEWTHTCLRSPLVLVEGVQVCVYCSTLVLAILECNNLARLALTFCVSWLELFVLQDRWLFP